jgi:hypothetical protein
MEHSPGSKAVPEFGAQPGEVLGVTWSGRRGGLDLDSHNPLRAELRNEINFPPFVLLAQMVEPSSRLT